MPPAGALAGEPRLLYVDLHLAHEITSVQAFDGLRLAGRKVRRPDLTVATWTTTSRRCPSGEVAPFPFDASERHRLLNGLDDIGLTLEHEAAIAEYEQRRGLARV